MKEKFTTLNLSNFVNFGPKNIVISKKNLYFESVLVLLIFCPKHIALFKKIGLPLESLSVFHKGSARVGPWHNAPPK